MRRPLVWTLGALALAVALTPSPAGATGVSPEAATPMQREQAQSRFVHGKQLFDKRQFDQALAEFRAALDVVASPNARLYAARCLREKGRLVEAYVEFGRTAVEAQEHAKEDPRYSRTASSALTERDAIAPLLGFLTVHVDHATGTTKLRVSGEEIAQGGWGQPGPVLPGDAEVVVETPSGAPVKQIVSIAAGEKRTVSIDAAVGATEEPTAPVTTATSTPTRADHSNLRPYAWIAGGVGAAGLITFAILGELSNSTYNDLAAQCGNQACPVSKQSDVSRGQTEQTIANIGLGVGLVGLAVGVTLFFVSIPPKDSAAPAAGAPATAGRPGEGAGGLRVTQILLSPSGLGVVGGF